MLALVKRPHIELSLHGEHVEELLAWIKKKYKVVVLADEPDDEFVPIESTEYWKEMERNRIGNLLAGSRLKAGLTQAQLAEKLEFRGHHTHFCRPAPMNGSRPEGLPLRSCPVAWERPSPCPPAPTATLP